MTRTGAIALLPGTFGGRFVTLSLQVTAVVLLALLAVKALVDVDNHFDSWWYHLPWAARLAGLMPADEFLFDPISAARFEGFPVLPELLQGLLWRATGRVESANLVSYVSLVAYVAFLGRYLRISWWLAVPALLAVPLVQAHATSTYVDLIANCAMAALIMLTFLTFIRPGFVRRETLVLFVVTAFLAANSKLQLIPLVALTLAFAAYPIAIAMRCFAGGRKTGYVTPLRLSVTGLALAAIFFVPLKNIALHGNPVYPVEVKVAGMVLNHLEPLPPDDLGAGTLTGRSRTTKWLYSVFEIGMTPLRDVRRWTVDSAAPPGAPMTIQGGFFNIYVAGHLLLFAVLLSRVGAAERRASLVLVTVMTAVTMVMPASHLLRYYLYWFICIISLNLYFLAALDSEWVRRIAGGAFLLFVLIVIDVTKHNFVRPRFHPLERLMAERVDERILRDVRSGGPVCLALPDMSRPFLYAPLWYRPAAYTIQVGPFHPMDEAEVRSVCAARRIIR